MLYLIQTAKKRESSIDVAKALHQSVETWEGGLSTTGGAIVPENFFWYLVDFEWTAGKWHYKNIKDTPYEVFVKDITGQRKTY